MDEIVHWPAFTMKQNLEGSKKVQTTHTTKILYEKYFLLDKITILRYFYIAIYINQFNVLSEIWFRVERTIIL